MASWGSISCQYVCFCSMLRPMAATEAGPLTRGAESPVIVIGCTGLLSRPIRRRVNWGRNTKKRGVQCRLRAAHIVAQKRIMNSNRKNWSNNFGRAGAAGCRMIFVRVVGLSSERAKFESELAVAIIGCIPITLNRHQLVSAYP
ncbi:hypothetical protein J3E69DRAFT_300657 [Trichoderma sp. SZMC 28015]